MQDVRQQPVRHHFLRGLSFCAILIALIVVINMILSYLMEPYSSSSDEMWKGFAAADSPDMIYTGSSQTMCAINPAVVDDALGTVSYNMATNMQSLHCSLDVIRTAYERYNISSAVLCIDYELLSTPRSDNSRAEESFYHAKAKISSLGQRIADTVSFVFDPALFCKAASLTYFFPWIYNRDLDIRNNIAEKQADSVLNTDGHRDTNGFEPSDEQVSEEKVFITYEESEEWSQQTSLAVPTITEENLTDYSRILAFCQEHDIHLTVIVVPYLNVFSIYDYSGYMDVRSQLISLAEDAGFEYYDFNLLLPSVYEKHNSEFKDYGHMNTKGADRFSAWFADFLQKAQQDPASVQEYFYKTDM